MLRKIQFSFSGSPSSNAILSISLNRETLIPQILIDLQYFQGKKLCHFYIFLPSTRRPTLKDRQLVRIIRKLTGWSGDAMALGKLSVPVH